MPIYRYKSTGEGCSYCREGFDELQSMSARPLAKCPRCKGKVIKCPALCSGGVGMLSNGNLRDKGFTKLKNQGGGTFEKLT